jgi:nucleotide-binding universal stress UspA family protein
MNSKRILVAASLTHGRDAAFERALALARASGAEIYLLHAIPPYQAFSAGATHRLERTAELKSRAEQAGVVVQTVEQHGDPAEIIELHANARAVDLIVMGADRTHGARWLRRRSIAERVLRRTTTPTLIVPMDDDAESGFGNLLVAVDLSPALKGLLDYAVRASTAALRTGVDLATRHGARLTMLHALEHFPRHSVVSGSEAWRAVQQLSGQKSQVAQWLESQARRFGYAGAVAQVVTGDAVTGIVNAASEANADLIVMGVARRTWLARLLLGSTLGGVLRRADVPVLIVPVAGGAESQCDQKTVTMKCRTASSFARA